MVDFIKTLIILAAFFMFAPALGNWIADSRKKQRCVFCFMLYLVALAPGKFTLMVWSMEKYRGHTKGFEGNLIEVLAIALIIASSKNKYPGWQKWAPGAVLYLLWCGVSLLSLFPAMQFSPLYACMACFKFTKAIITLMGAYHFMRDEEDLTWMLRTLAWLSIWYAELGLWTRFIGGIWQFMGYFEHQNPMAMWCYLNAFPLLAAALHGSTKTKDFILYLAGYGGAALCILLSVSRAGLGALCVGSALVMLFAWIRKPNARVISVTISSVFAVMFVSAFMMNSFRARLNEVKESAEATEFDLRDILNMQSRAMLADSALGIGMNNFGVANSRPYGAKFSAILEDWDASRGFTIYDENYYQNPLTESLYYLLLAETGYPGFIAFVLFAAATVYFALRSAIRFRKSLAGVVSAALMIGLCICYLHGTVERILTQTKNLAQWMMICGTVAALEQRRRILTNKEVMAELMSADLPHLQTA